MHVDTNIKPKFIIMFIVITYNPLILLFFFIFFYWNNSFASIDFQLKSMRLLTKHSNKYNVVNCKTLLNIGDEIHTNTRTHARRNRPCILGFKRKYPTVRIYV